MAWVSGKTKDSSGDVMSIRGSVSDVEMQNGTSAATAMSALDTQAAALSSGQTALTTAVTRLRSQAGLTEGLNTLSGNVATLSAALAEVLGV